MKRLVFFLLGLSSMVIPLFGQEYDETFLFVDEEYEVIENGAVIIRNAIETTQDATEIIKANVSVLDNGAGPNDVLVMHYSIKRIDNGNFQICFPITCNSRNEVGDYVTAAGQVTDGVQDIQSEWLPTDNGICAVTLSIEVQTKTDGFPPRYEHKAYGPSINILFRKGETPPDDGGSIPGDANGDGEVNLGDVNVTINAVLSGNGDYDVNNDGEVNLSDVNYIIDIILNQ